MKLLVIIPMFNSERFIEECIKSIINQDIDLKIIAVDDASTDNSLNIASKFKDITIIKNNKNMGTYYSINRALFELSKDFSWTHHTVHGADDISFPNRFKKQMRYFKSRPANILSVGCMFKRTDYKTKKTYKTNPNTNESVLIFSRKIFESIGYYDTGRVGCDTEYKKRMLLNFPNSTYNIREFLICSYLHEHNLTKTIPAGGTYRRSYVNKFKNQHIKMKKNNNFYKDFKP